MSDSSNAGSQWQALVDSSGGALTAEDAESLRRAGADPFCILKCVAELVKCGVTKPECQQRFIQCVLRCITGGGADAAARG